MSINSGTPGIRFCFMTFCIILVPSPQKWNRDSGRLSAPPLFSRPNIRRSQSVAELRRAFPANRVESPEGEKHRDLHPHGSGPGGNNERGHGLDPVAAQQHDRDRQVCDSRSSANATAGSICAS